MAKSKQLGPELKFLLLIILLSMLMFSEVRSSGLENSNINFRNEEITRHQKLGLNDVSDDWTIVVVVGSYINYEFFYSQ